MLDNLEPFKTKKSVILKISKIPLPTLVMLPELNFFDFPYLIIRVGSGIFEIFTMTDFFVLNGSRLSSML